MNSRYVATLVIGSSSTATYHDSLYLLGMEIKYKEFDSIKIYDRNRKRQIFAGSYDSFLVWWKSFVEFNQAGLRTSVQSLARKTSPVGFSPTRIFDRQERFK